MKVKLELKWADLWIGAFYKRDGNYIHVWVRILPCLPIHLIFDRTRKQAMLLAKMIKNAREANH